jgi:hypothetical protein
MQDTAANNDPKRNPVADLLSGRMLTQDAVVKHLPYLLFLAFIGILYIANGYLAESSVRKINRTQQEIKELRSEQISMKSELNNTIIESELNRIIQQRNLGLTESFDPPKKIVLESSEMDEIN